MTTRDSKSSTLARLRSLSAELRESLLPISEARGRYSKDRHQHAINCVEDMKADAVAALARLDALDVEIAQLEEQMQEDVARNRTGEAAPVRPVHAESATMCVCGHPQKWHLPHGDGPCWAVVFEDEGCLCLNFQPATASSSCAQCAELAQQIEHLQAQVRECFETETANAQQLDDYAIRNGELQKALEVAEPAVDYFKVRERLDAAEQQIEQLQKALSSIANSSCCGCCQEAALVAKQALVDRWRESESISRKNSDNPLVPLVDQRQCLGVSQAYSQCADELAAVLAQCERERAENESGKR